MAIEISSRLTLAQLEKLAFHCGISKTGTKPILRQRLVDTLATHRPLASGTRVLSIDLGIRNLAYSLLVPPPLNGNGGGRNASPHASAIARPSVHAWQRLALSSKMPARTGAGQAEEGSELANLIEDFTPSAFSTIATNLVRDQLLPLKPTHVLVERQRFRSGGGSSVLEWTVRVNTLEAMLYAIFSTLRSLRQWDGEVIPIEPRRVGPFLLTRAGMIQEADLSKRTKAENKKLKIDLLSGWLQSGEKLDLANEQVRAMSNAYLHRWKKSPKARKPGEVSQETGLNGLSKLVKLDDLADSLLQGVAFLEWEANKATLLENGVEWFTNHGES